MVLTSLGTCLVLEGVTDNDAQGRSVGAGHKSETLTSATFDTVLWSQAK